MIDICCRVKAQERLSVLGEKKGRRYTSGVHFFSKFSGNESKSSEQDLMTVLFSSSLGHSRCSPDPTAPASASSSPSSFPLSLWPKHWNWRLLP